MKFHHLLLMSFLSEKNHTKSGSIMSEEPDRALSISEKLDDGWSHQRLQTRPLPRLSARSSSDSNERDVSTNEPKFASDSLLARPTVSRGVQTFDRHSLSIRRSVA